MCVYVVEDPMITRKDSLTFLPLIDGENLKTKLWGLLYNTHKYYTNTNILTIHTSLLPPPHTTTHHYHHYSEVALSEFSAISNTLKVSIGVVYVYACVCVCVVEDPMITR